MYGGDIVVVNTEFTWIVIIGSFVSGEGLKQCTGSVVASVWVLTAAHCLVNRRGLIPSDRVLVSVYFGIGAFQVFKVRSTFVHPNWIRDQADLSMTKKDLGLIQTMKHIGVPTGVLSMSPEYPTSTCTIAGFGIQTLNKSGHTTLSKIKVKLMNEVSCLTSQGLDTSLRCLFVVDGVGPCVGDSGSPLVCEGKIVGVCSRAIFTDKDESCGTYRFSIVLYQGVDVEWTYHMMEKYTHSSGCINGWSARLLTLVWLLLIWS